MPDVTEATADAVTNLPGLAQIADRIAALDVPDEPIDPAGTWSSSYSILAADGGGVAGHVTLSRQPTHSGAALAVDWAKSAGGASHWNVVTAIQSKADALGTTLNWRASSVRRSSRFDAPGDPVAGTAFVVTGDVSPEQVRFVTNGAKQPERLDVAQPVTFDWQLFDVVQRLPRGEAALGPFAVVDGIGGMRAGQRLTFAGGANVSVARGVRRLHRYDLVGPGTVPATYWVDDRTSRLLAVVSGLEAHLLGRLPPGGGRDRSLKPGRKGATEASQY